MFAPLCRGDCWKQSLAKSNARKRYLARRLRRPCIRDQTPTRQDSARGLVGPAGSRIQKLGGACQRPLCIESSQPGWYVADLFAANGTADQAAHAMLSFFAELQQEGQLCTSNR